MNAVHLSVLSLVIIGVLFLLYQNYSLRKEGIEFEKKLESISAEYASTTDAYTSLQKDFVDTKKELDQFKDGLQKELAKVGEVTGQMQSITGAVGDIEKLQNTDEELLQKYSKVFFLSEHYRPSSLTQIETRYTYNPEKDEWIHGDVWSYLKSLMDSANRSGIDIRIKSAFRSFETQVDTKSSYAVIYGEGTANQFSADQGYSEHQLGSTVDFITAANGNTFYGFGDTEEYRWLTENAHKYGFVLSYPENNTYYQFEPWHWRFVGVELATRLHNDGKTFYYLDQREIDQYLISLFD